VKIFEIVYSFYEKEHSLTIYIIESRVRIGGRVFWRLEIKVKDNAKPKKLPRTITVRHPDEMVDK
jgi:hypothetical protein